MRAAALAFGAAMVAASVGPAAAQPAGEAMTPEEATAKICSGCHSTQIVMDTPRDYDAWHQTVQDMIDRGAQGTQDDFALVMQFLYENMTTIDVNHADEEDLMTILKTTKPVADAIIARRSKKAFKDIADLENAVPGLDAALLEAKKRMIHFQQ
jgi:hypothetical protein